MSITIINIKLSATNKLVDLRIHIRLAVIKFNKLQSFNFLSWHLNIFRTKRASPEKNVSADICIMFISPVMDTIPCLCNLFLSYFPEAQEVGGIETLQNAKR